MKTRLRILVVLLALCFAPPADAWPTSSRLLNTSYASNAAIPSDYFPPPAGTQATSIHLIATTAGTAQLWMIDGDGNPVQLTALIPGCTGGCAVSANADTVINWNEPSNYLYVVFTPTTNPGSVRVYAFAAGANVH